MYRRTSNSNSQELCPKRLRIPQFHAIPRRMLSKHILMNELCLTMKQFFFIFFIFASSRFYAKKLNSTWLSQFAQHFGQNILWGKIFIFFPHINFSFFSTSNFSFFSTSNFSFFFSKPHHLFPNMILEFFHTWYMNLERVVVGEQQIVD